MHRLLLCALALNSLLLSARAVVKAGVEDPAHNDEDSFVQTDDDEADAIWGREWHPLKACGRKLRHSSTTSQFQKIEVFDTSECGKALLLDGVIQSASLDEHHYHEALVHPAMIAHGSPKTVYIGGGGELATAREVLRYSSVEKVVMVDIDKKLVEFCRAELPEWNGGAFEDHRLSVKYGDAVKALAEYPGTFDVIIMDISDPLDEPAVHVCYSPEHYATVYKKLNPGGILVTQSGSCAYVDDPWSFSGVHANIAASFSLARSQKYCAEVESFGGLWAFVIAVKGNGNADNDSTQLPSHMGVDVVDERVQRLISDLDVKKMHRYNGERHRAYFDQRRWEDAEELADLTTELVKPASAKLGNPPTVAAQTTAVIVQFSDGTTASLQPGFTLAAIRTSQERPALVLHDSRGSVVPSDMPLGVGTYFETPQSFKDDL